MQKRSQIAQSRAAGNVPLSDLAAISRDDLIKALREAIREPSLARSAEEAYFKRVNKNWRDPVGCSDPIIDALAVLLQRPTRGAK